MGGREGEDVSKRVCVRERKRARETERNRVSNEIRKRRCT